ncbi:nicotinate phosphoribosyltransferase [Brachyspira hyodysenteriae]|nr:nicotinate phosphoribosyltransferase [Brachyspira hyodysenteriae]MCZ9891902.1 nicotinate phosphoribosyltransferase [Brachyspira hyodysenteriae]MCZ9997812.1 nicotinate phosphoribosyltransferase [Brachyspira hyodysenteriae]MDA0001249.1 nicotinate phosphoribosyltransferase [Brachyspira hyodysenteriae]MDA0006263.1 nicotinate phosphoribosyltransferase [Brachyspira hyodysenteriae]MDA0029090.1 nicotinate phosphoribosyltransferase [Brachyspira hyodysenteriae]
MIGREKVVTILKEKLPPKCLVGTSNVYFAKTYDLLAVGTNAHEYYQIGQALDKVRLAESQKFMLQSWVNEYRGDLGIALSDTLGTDKFLKDFDLYFAKLYDGIRHDSGDPFVWGHKVINHYKKLRVDPRTKTLLFSDSLNFDKAYNIYKEFKDETNVAFGIGTYITNDFEPIAKPLNIVMKLQSVNGKPVAKISDDEGKTICEDDAFLNYLKIVAKE